MRANRSIAVGPGRVNQREIWLRTAAGIGQLTLGTWLLVAWLIGAPSPILASLVIASLALVLLSRRHWRGR